MVFGIRPVTRYSTLVAWMVFWTHGTCCSNKVTPFWASKFVTRACGACVLTRAGIWLEQEALRGLLFCWKCPTIWRPSRMINHYWRRYEASTVVHKFFLTFSVTQLFLDVGTWKPARENIGSEITWNETQSSKFAPTGGQRWRQAEVIPVPMWVLNALKY